MLCCAGTDKRCNVVPHSFVISWVVVAVVTASIMDNLAELRETKAKIVEDLDSRCFMCNIARQV
jgi:hypothetical protein